MIRLKKRSAVIFLFFLFFDACPQNWVHINELMYDADYFFMDKQYYKAIKYYSEILKQIPDNANLVYKLGVCYLHTETEKEKSIPYFIEASQKINPDYNPDSYKEFGAPPITNFLLGSAYRVSNQLDKAIEAYTNYLKSLNPKDTKEKQITEQYIKSCENAKKMMGDPETVILTNMGSPINDEYTNFNIVISGDGNTLTYVTTKKDVNNIMISNKINGVWSKPKLITKQITSRNNFKATGLSFDGTIMYLVEDDPFNSEIYISIANRGKWSKGEKLKKPINTKMNETHASLSPDGKTLYFTSDRNDGLGDLDIYYSKVDEKGKWGKPVNMGDKVNTLFNEETPFVSNDGERLYFSSEGFNGMGGYDIFYINLKEEGSTPVNLGYPVNTTDNDLFFFPGNSRFEGYTSRIEKNEFNTKDIYSLEIQPTFKLKGQIVADNSSAFIDTNIFQISLSDLSNYSVVAEFKPFNERGEFERKLPTGKYQLTVNAQNYESFTHEFEFNKEVSNPEYFIEAKMVNLAPVFVAQETSLINETPVTEPLTDILYPETKITETPTEPVTEVSTLSETETRPAVTERSIPTVIPKETINKQAPVKKGQYISDNTENNYIDEVVDEVNNISSIPQGASVTYTIQLYALRKPIDLKYLKNIKNVKVSYSQDQYYKYTWGNANTLEEAKDLRDELISKGFNNVIIRRRAIVPKYTIQLMAGRNSLNFSYFNKFDKLKVTLGNDGFYRYSYGEYSNLDDINADIEKLKKSGYTNIFIKKLDFE